MAGAAERLGPEVGQKVGEAVGLQPPRADADAAAADAWRRLYSRYFPFRFQPDNFTTSLHDYYGFHQVDAGDGSLVLELGEITCPAQQPIQALFNPSPSAMAISARFCKRSPRNVKSRTIAVKVLKCPTKPCRSVTSDQRKMLAA